ncbi:MAG: BatA domain-containing protein, partial [Limisphaerales bacterium]
MTFLQPILLYALPLILLPVLIHLLNRLRHRTQQWGAMRFLVAASRSSVNRARLKQFLILLFRTLAVLMLILFLARPLTGGWMGWAFA